MVDEEEKKEEQKFEFDEAGEAIGYISLDQARVLAMRTAMETSGAYGRRYRAVPMAFEVLGDEETEDHYVISLSFRPQGEFEGTPGREQFFVEKEGTIAVRQVMGLPRPAGALQLRITLAIIGVAALVAAAVAGGLIFAGGGDGGDEPGAEPAPAIGTAPVSTPTPAAVSVAAPALQRAFLRKWGTEGTGDGQLDRPYGIALDEAGNVYVTDFNNDRVQKFSSEGQFLLKWGSGGDGDGQLNGLPGIALDGLGNVYVADFDNDRIQKFSSDERFLLKWGSPGTEEGQIQGAATIAVDGFDNVYVTERRSHRVQVFDTNGRFLGMWGTRSLSEKDAIRHNAHD